MSSVLPDLRSLHDPRHPGLTRALSAAYAEAAEVCLARHHKPPETRFTVECAGQVQDRQLRWAAPTVAAQRAFNNQDDATRDGAYILAISAVEKELGLVTLLRAETRIGADYYVGAPDAEDIENAYRLEVSGVDAQTMSAVRSRLNRKIEQAQNGLSDLPAFASVVGFLHRRILISPIPTVG